jgi:Exonuclease C-terminal.
MRSFSEHAGDSKKAEWVDWVRQKLLGEGEYLNLPKFESEIAQLRRETMLAEQKHRLLDELLKHASDIRAKYEIDDDLAMQG